MHIHTLVALELLSTADCGCIDNDQLVAQTACRPAAPLPHYLQLRVAPFVKLEKPLFLGCILWLFRLPAASTNLYFAQTFTSTGKLQSQKPLTSEKFRFIIK